MLNIPEDASLLGTKAWELCPSLQVLALVHKESGNGTLSSGKKRMEYENYRTHTQLK